jgi:hypothetical protein
MSKESNEVAVIDLTFKVGTSARKTSFRLKICLIIFSTGLICHVVTGAHPEGDTPNINKQHNNKKI